MPNKETVKLDMAGANTNLSPATKFGNLVFVAGQTGRHPTTGEVGKDIREQTRNVLERIKVVLEAAGTLLDNVLTVTTYLTNVRTWRRTTRNTRSTLPTPSRRGPRSRSRR